MLNELLPTVLITTLVIYNTGTLGLLAVEY